MLEAQKPPLFSVREKWEEEKGFGKRLVSDFDRPGRHPPRSIHDRTAAEDAWLNSPIWASAGGWTGRLADPGHEKGRVGKPARPNMAQRGWILRPSSKFNVFFYFQRIGLHSYGPKFTARPKLNQEKENYFFRYS